MKTSAQEASEKNTLVPDETPRKEEIGALRFLEVSCFTLVGSSFGSDETSRAAPVPSLKQDFKTVVLSNERARVSCWSSLS